MNLYNQPSLPQHQAHGPPNSLPDYINNTVQSEIFNQGLNQGRDAILKRTDQFTTKASGFWSSLRYYFSVNNSFVSKRILTLLYPPLNTNWYRLSARSSTDNFEGVVEEVNSGSKWALPSHDINAPDLYIPLMSFMTYVLLCGVGKGILDASAFSPDILIQTVWRCLALQTLESALILFGINLITTQVSFMDIFAYTGYKYVGLSINTLARGLGGSLHFIFTLYTAGMLGFFVLKTFAAAVPESTTAAPASPPRHLVLLGIAGLQFAVVLILSYL